jgi:hypothetical protein
MMIIDKIEKFLFEAPFWKFISLLFIIMLFKTGIFYQPNLFDIYLEAAQNPYKNIFIDRPDHQFAYTSYFGGWLAFILGATNKTSFFLLHLFFSILSSFFFIKIVLKNFSNEVARISLILFFIFPVSSTIYYLVGYDSFTIFFMTLALYLKRYTFLTLLIGIFLGLQHFELSFFGSGALFLGILISIIIKERKINTILFPLSLFIGVILGKIFLYYIFEFNNMNIVNDRATWYIESLPHLLHTFFFRFYNIIWFSIGIGWFVIFKFYNTLNKKISFFLPFICMILMLIIIPDTTRTFSVMSFLLISYFIFLNENFLKFISRVEITIIFILWAIIPYGWVWQGIPRPSHLSYSIGYILKNFVDWFDKTSIDSSFVWPFFHAF